MKKICAFGMDGFIIPLMKRFASEGAVPNFQRMWEEGTVNQLQPSFPVWTPTNWATLVTGAHTGTHGATRWHVDMPGGERISSFHGRAISAERIWNALERAGLKGAAAHYPAAQPSGGGGYIVDGFGHPGPDTPYQVAKAQGYVAARQSDGASPEMIQMDHDGTAARRGQRALESLPTPGAAAGWSGLPPSASPPLASQLQVHGVDGGTSTFHLLIVDSQGRGYDRVLLCTHRDARAPLLEARAGEWSNWAVYPFATAGEMRRGAFRIKVQDLAPDASYLRLYRGQITYADGFTVPDELADELLGRFGPYQEHASLSYYASGVVDFDTALEECEYQGLWFADVANYLLHEQGCSYFTCHWHLYDYLNHLHLGDVDPVGPGYDPSRAEEITDYFRRAYQVGDRILERLWEAADGETYVGVVADHGAYPDIRVANIRQFLVERGFLVPRQGAQGLELDQLREEGVDWDRTRAYLKDDKGFDIYINAPPGADFEAIEAKLILALRTWTDEEVGRTPVAIALPKRDAYLLGQWGDQCGDIVFAWDHGYVSGYFGQWQEIVGGKAAGAPLVYGAHHGGFLPAQTELSSTFATLLLAGPGLKRGYERPVARLGYIHIADVVPTFCHLLGVQPPGQSQGAIAYDLLEGHDMPGHFESTTGA